MNKVYKSVWNESIGAWVAASENSPARGKSSAKKLAVKVASASAALGATVGMLSPISVLAQNAPYLGSEDNGVDTCSRAGSNMQPCEAWSSGFTAVSGSRLAYLTSLNGTSEGGVWAGNLSSGLFYGSGPGGTNGVVIDASGTTVSGTDLTLRSTNGVNVSSGKIINVAAGTSSTDAVNLGQLSPLVTALGGKAALDSKGAMTAPSYTIGAKSYDNVGDALTALSAASGTNKYFHVNSTLEDSTAVGTESVAIGGEAAANSNGDISIGSYSSATGSSDSSGSAIAIGTHAEASSMQTLALGTSATAASNGDVAIGTLAQATGTGAYGSATAVGFSTIADGKLASALGYRATATGANSVALGANSVADLDNTVSVGSSTKQRRIVNVAAGTQAYDAVNVTQLQSVTALLGGGAKVNADGTVQAPTYTVAGAQAGTVGDAISKIDSELSNKVAYDTADKSQVTLGGVGAANPTKLTNLKIGDLSSTSTDAINGSQLYSTNQRVGSLETFETNINNGGGIKYFHANSTLADSSATGTDSVAIGGAALSSGKNSVALGSNSVADRDNTVSVGAAGKERQITNVAAGTASTDAVNLGQLTAVSNNVDTLGSFAVKYDTDANGAPDYQKITLGGAGATKPTLLTNVKAGGLNADSTDAVNGSQLFATNTNVAALQDFTNNISNGGGIKYFHSNSTLADSSATGANSVAIGGAAVSSGKNSVALGSNSVADRDNSVSVGAAGGERQITNVAAGTASTDAANVGQLNAVSNSVTALGASAIKYDTSADGTPDYANATLGNGNASGTALHNVAAGTSSMDAVNLGQINDMIGQVTNLANGAYNPMFTADGSRDTEAATSSGTYSVASGAKAVASGANSVASGVSSVASGANAVAVGANSSATAKNSVALGAGSVADRANSVSVGTTAAGGQRQITNVEAGTEGTDAVNVNQMQQSVNTGVKSAKGYTDALRSDMNSGLSLANNHINSVGAMSSAMAMMAGSAAAIADKDNRFAAGTGVYRDKAAIAIGFQKRFGTNMVLTIGGSTTGEETTGGAGFAFGF